MPENVVISVENVSEAVLTYVFTEITTFVNEGLEIFISPNKTILSHVLEKAPPAYV